MSRVPASLLFFALAFSASAFSKAPESQATSMDKIPGLVDASSVVKGLQVELKYSTTDNFMKKDVYGDLEKCYLQEDAAKMLGEAQKDLVKIRPDLRFVAYDCARPLSVQKKMWELVKDTPSRSYVANPDTKTGSIHNYGCAIDLSLAKTDGTPLDMGTPFDFFGRKAQPRYELTLLRQAKLTHEQVANRLLLRQVMVRAGFTPISSEWWHFNCASTAETRRRYKKIQ